MGKNLLGKQIAVFGGGGKTSLARAIAKKLEVPHIELDAIHHMPNWVERPYDEFAQIVERRLDDSPGGWVIDSNYRRIRPLMLDRADTVIVIQLPFPVMFWRILKRSIHRTRTGQPMWNGNNETWRMTFATSESILLEIIRKRKTYANIGKIIAQDTPPEPTSSSFGVAASWTTFTNCTAWSNLTNRLVPAALTGLSAAQ